MSESDSVKVETARSEPAPGAGSGGVMTESVRFPGGPPMSSPKFGGEGSFSRFVADFDTFASMYAWADEFKVRFLPLCLTGVARDAFDSLPEGKRATYDCAVQGLRDLFAKPNSLDAHAELGRLRFDPSGSLDAFVIRFNLLMKQAFPGQDIDTVRFNYFLSSLPESYQTDIIASGITSFAAALEKTRNVCRAEKRRAAAGSGSERGSADVRHVEAGPGTATMLDQILSRIAELEKHVSQRRPVEDFSAVRGRAPARGGRGRAGPSSRTCFVCGSPGHLAAACRSRGRVCYGCGRMGHLVAVCPTRSGNGAGDPGFGPGGLDPQRPHLPEGQ